MFRSSSGPYWKLLKCFIAFLHQIFECACSIFGLRVEKSNTSSSTFSWVAKNIPSNRCKCIEHKSQTFRRTHLGLHAGLYNTSENHWIKSSPLVESAYLACKFYLSCAQSEERCITWGLDLLEVQSLGPAPPPPPPTESTNSGGAAQPSVNELALQGIFIPTEVWESLPILILLLQPQLSFSDSPKLNLFQPNTSHRLTDTALNCITDCAKYRVLRALCSVCN